MNDISVAKPNRDGRPRMKKETVIDVAGLTPDAAKWSRIFDFLVVGAVVTLFMGAMHLHVMLTVGDWDMFTDWKDRQYWVLLYPISAIMFPAALQAVFWTYFRLPIGATVGGVLLLLAVWITRIVQWHVWAGFPFSMMLPSVILPGAILMDVVLIVCGNGLFAAIFGGWLFGFTFWPANYEALALAYMPVNFHGTMASVSDMVGYTFLRSNMPEYLRIIERGTLRTFGGQVAWISGAFSAFICIIMHFLWWNLGVAMSTVKFVPNGKRMLALMGMKAPSATKAATASALPNTTLLPLA